MKPIITLLTFIVLTFTISAQHLKPGFDKAEYINLMKVSAQFGDSGYGRTMAPPADYRFFIPLTGCRTRKLLGPFFMNNNGVAVISIRGTTADKISWLANFYAAMVPAKGSLTLSTGKQLRHPGCVP